MPQVNKIKIRRGLNANIPAPNTEVGELRYSTDSKELYIDDGSSNVKIGGDPTNFPLSTATKSYVDTADAAHVAATDPHTQYMNSDRGDARYASEPYAVMAKSQFASLPSSYGILGRIFGNDGYKNDLQVYGLSTQAGTPTPDVPVPIVSTTGNVTVRSDSKNLITLDSVNATNNGVTITFNSDGSITLNGTASATTYFDINNSRKTQIYTGMQLTLSSGINLPTGVKIVLRQSNPNLVYLNVNAGSSSVSGSIGSTASGLAYTFFEVLSGTVLNNVTIRPQLEVGTVATTFEKNINSTQTLPLGTTQLRSLPNGVSDRIYKDGSTWKLERWIERIVLNGTQSFIIHSATNADYITFRYPNADIKPQAPYSPGIIGVQSDRFRNITWKFMNDNALGVEGVSTHDSIGQLFLTILKSRLTELTQSGINTWLAANNTVVEYEKTTPVTTDVTDPTLITALENIRTYQGVTNITASTPVSGSYGLDLTKTLAGKVGTTGNQTIAGVKTFTSAPIAPSGTSIGGVLYLTGVGFPNGVVTAPVGSVYIDTVVTNGASSWIKKSGIGNTGWQVLEGDTGWRNITSLAPAGNVTSGGFDIRRKGDTVLLRLRGLATAGANTVLIANFRGDIGTGFEPGENINAVSRVSISGVVTTSFLVQPASPTQGIVRYDSGTVMFAATSWASVNDWPTTLPGTAI